MLREGGAVSGIDIILLGVCSGQLQIYKSAYFPLLVHKEIIGDPHCEFRQNGSIIDHIFFIFQIFEGVGER